MEPKQLLDTAEAFLDKKKALDIRAIPTGEQTILADYFLLATGTSSTHVKSLADDLEAYLEELGVRPRQIEGRATGWILLDYGAVLIHIFTKEQREYYNMERLWG